MERLQRVIAARGGASRRAAEALITAGRVSVNGNVVTELGVKVDPRTAQIRIDGRPLPPQRLRYILLNKPRGYITTTSDERNRRTVMELIDIKERVYPVGRLDRNTDGLLLLTNDGELANRIMHPRYLLDKEYQVLTPSRPSEASLRQLRAGIEIDGTRVVPTECRILRETTEGVVIKIVIHQGLYHVVRRMMEAVRIPIGRLRRVRLGPLTLTGIAPGTWRDLTPGELAQIQQALHLDQTEPPPNERGPRAPRPRRPPTPGPPRGRPAKPVPGRPTRRPRHDDRTNQSPARRRRR